MLKEFGKSRNGVLLLLLLVAQIIGFSHYALVIPNVMAAEFPLQWDYHDGSYTHIEKLGVPVSVQLGIGSGWVYVYDLDNDTRYHIYFHGDWLDTETDYDIAIYDPDGQRIPDQYHTESHGLIEHTGTNYTWPFFHPEKDGEYSIYIMNDPKESTGTATGTLMVVENIDINRFYADKLYLEGKDPGTNENRPSTTWVYEFNTSSNHIEIPVTVPENLDMYEVRLYLMANPAVGLGQELLGMPIAWEPGLYDGTHESSVGGSSIEDTAYRGNAFDSCEYWGEDMLINYTSPYSGNLLYHLVFIAELGAGNPSFVIKTDFTAPYLAVTGPGKVLPGEEATITAVSNDTESGVEMVNLSYSLDNGLNWNTMKMNQSQPHVYTGTIPGQPIGAPVFYKVEALDFARNKAVEEGSYQSKYLSQVLLSLSASKISGGESITLEGLIVPPKADANVLIQYIDPEDSIVYRSVTTGSLGNFTDSFTPDKAGVWEIQASWDGDLEYFGASNTTSLTVDKIAVTLDLTIQRSITVGNTLEITGSATPTLPYATIKIYVTDPEGTLTISDVQTSSQGGYSLDLIPESKGSWIITAVFSGDALHRSASSSSFTCDVTGGFFDWPTVVIIPIAAAVIIIVFFMLRRRRSTLSYEGF